MAYTLQDFLHRDTTDQASLTEALAWASYQYYVNNDPPMSDYEFDMEYKMLQAMEQASGHVMDGSPTQRVGSDLQGGFEKHRHIIPMQSIENVYSDDELDAWLQTTTQRLAEAFPADRVTYTCEPKYDGLSISLVYTDGVLTDAVTRGNQAEGESVTANVRTILNVPLTLPTGVVALPHYLEVRGEVLMPRGAFERLNAERTAAGQRPFANQRNAASGSLKQLDPKVTARRGLIVAAYAAYSTDADFQAREMASQEQTLRLLDRLGFSRYAEGGVAYDDLEALRAAIHAFNAVRTARQLPYDCDGVVVKVNLRRHQEYLGLGTTAPAWCKARKFPQEAQEAIVLGVTFQVGMTGRITPVAELEPTVIAGSLVSRATLNNERYIQTLGLSIGSSVKVRKAGEVIPQVVGVNPEGSAETLVPITFPTECPCCGTPLVRRGEYWVCPGRDCKEQAVQRLAYWCSKDCADIRGLGAEVLSDLYDKLGVHTVLDLYRTFVADAAEMEGTPLAAAYEQNVQERLGEGYGTRSVGQMFAAIRQSVASLTLDRAIAGLGIEGVGGITGRALAAHFGSYAALRAATLDDLTAVEGIGETTATAILQTDCTDFDQLFALLPFHLTYQAAERLSSALEGLTVIFTGTSTRMKRDEIKAFFTGHGAKYVGSVSGKVSYVITGDAPGQNKLDKARQLGVEVISEQDFYQKFGL